MACTFDACIFGAGPAGLAVAARLLDLGRKVAVLDRRLKVRDWGGESFTGAIRGPLAALGFWDDFVKAGHVPGFERQVAWGGGPYCESSLVQLSGHMWHVDRDRFDEALRDVIRRRADLFASYQKLCAITRASGEWRLALDDGKTELAARYLVDATGRSRMLAKWLGARVTFYDRLIGLTAAVSGGSTPIHVASLMIQSMPFGWWYAAPVPRGHIVALFTDADLAVTALRRRLRPVAANSVLTDTAEDEAWIPVGDACASHDPLCGWGVHRALSNGILAAEAIDDFLRTGSARSLGDYRSRCRQQFRDYLEGLTRHYAIERRWADAPFWERRLGGRHVLGVT
jgi:flavin-dependent dehydrogenase